MPRTQLNNYQLLLELERFSLMWLYSIGKKAELGVLDPRYWELMNNLGANEIEFINFSYYDARKSDSSLEGYQDLISKDYNTIFTEVKRSRYVDIFITSVRNKKDAVLKLKYYGGEDKLAYKKPAYGQIVTLLQEKIKKKDEMAVKIDEQNR